MVFRKGLKVSTSHHFILLKLFFFFSNALDHILICKNNKIRSNRARIVYDTIGLMVNKRNLNKYI